MLNQNKDCKCGHVTVSNKIKFEFSPVTEDVRNETSKLKGKFSVNYYEIPEKLVTERFSLLRKHEPLFIMFCNLSKFDEDHWSLAHSPKKKDGNLQV
jgi:hypothetical protein